jgi:hypothetical protein
LLADPRARASERAGRSGWTRRCAKADPEKR